MVRASNVAEHSFHVTWIHIWLSRRMGVPISIGVLVDTLEHDAEEAVTGDIPATSKAQWVDPEVECPHYYIRKMADIMEFMITCTEEKWMGNKRLTPAYNHALMRMMKVGEAYNTRFNAECDPWTLLNSLLTEMGR